MKAHIVIPARLSSARFPSKLLTPISGITVLGRTIDAAKHASERGQEEVIVASSDPAIWHTARACGADWHVTSTRPRNGTERCAEVAAARRWPEEDIVVNWQGDAPFINGGAVIDMIAALVADPKLDMVTLGAMLPKDQERANTTVKVFTENHGALMRAKNFSRWPGSPTDPQLWHIGVYAYRVFPLLQYAALDRTVDEELEGLEQLRAIHMGLKIGVHYVQGAPGPEINRPDDIRRAEEWLRGGFFACDLCEQSFRSVGERVAHYRQAHPDSIAGRPAEGVA